MKESGQDVNVVTFPISVDDSTAAQLTGASAAFSSSSAAALIHSSSTASKAGEKHKNKMKRGQQELCALVQALRADLDPSDNSDDNVLIMDGQTVLFLRGVVVQRGSYE